MPPRAPTAPPISQRRPGSRRRGALVERCRGAAEEPQARRRCRAIVGRMSAGPAPGPASTAAAPTTPTTAKSDEPRRRGDGWPGRRSRRTPARARATVPTSRARLSLVPNVAMAKSLSHGGVRSMKAPPTAAIGAGCPDDWPTAVRTDAASVASPTVSSPATSPSRAPHHSGRTGCCGAVSGRWPGWSWSWPQVLLQVWHECAEGERPVRDVVLLVGVVLRQCAFVAVRLVGWHEDRVVAEAAGAAGLAGHACRGSVPARRPTARRAGRSRRRRRTPRRGARRARRRAARGAARGWRGRRRRRTTGR